MDGRVVKVDGDHRNPVTRGYICAKVRRTPEHLYGPDRLLYPARRIGPKGEGRFERISWDEALDLAAARLRRGAGALRGGVDPPLLLRRLERPADPGHHRRPPLPPDRRLAARAHGLRRALGTGGHRALRQDGGGRLPGLPARAADRPLGGEPLGLRHSSRPVHPGGPEGGGAAGGDRSPPDAARQEGRPVSRAAAGDRPGAGAGRHPLVLRERTRGPRLPGRARDRRRGAAAAGSSAGPSSARPRSPASPPRRSRASSISTPSPRRP